MDKATAKASASGFEPFIHRIWVFWWE